MTAKEYLSQAYRLNELIDSDIAELNDLNAMKYSISGTSYDKERVSGGNIPGSKIENIIAKITQLETEINAEIDRYIDLKITIRRIISTLEKPNERLVLRLRYIEFKEWDEIQADMGFTDVRRVHQIHNEALKNFPVPAQ